jgi:hypothetical protein
LTLLPLYGFHKGAVSPTFRCFTAYLMALNVGGLAQVKSVFLSFNGKVNSITETKKTSLSIVGSYDSQYRDELLGSSWSSLSSCEGSFALQEEDGDSRNLREFSLRVTVKASQAEQPLGMARIMSVLEAAVATGTRTTSP